MIRRPPRSTRTDTLFPTRRSSDLRGDLPARVSDHPGLRAPHRGDHRDREPRRRPRLHRHQPAREGRSMSAPSTMAVLTTARPRRRRSLFVRLLHRPAAVIALGYLLLVVLLAILAPVVAPYDPQQQARSEEHTSELQSLMR